MSAVTPGDNILNLIAIIKKKSRFEDPITKGLVIKALEAINSDLVKGEYDMPIKTKKAMTDLIDHVASNEGEVETEKPEKTKIRKPLLPIDEDDDS